MTQAPPSPNRVLALAQAGDAAGAVAAGEAMLASGDRDAGLAMFVGVMSCRIGDLARGIVHLRRAVEWAPREMIARAELARALLSAGEDADAETIARPVADPATPLGREMQRILAHALARQKQGEAAAPLFDALIRADVGDFESWRGLGVARLLSGDTHGAIEALSEATRLRPAIAGAWTDLARAHSAAFAPEKAREAAGRAAGLAPQDAAAQLELARALSALRRLPEALAALSVARTVATDDVEGLCAIAEVAIGCKALDTAEADYARAIALQPAAAQAWRGLANVLERTGRVAELHALVETGELAGVPRREMALAQAKALRSADRLDEAQAVLAEIAEDDADQVGRLQLAGDIADRRGEADTAFAKFTEANALLASRADDTLAHADAYRDRFVRLGHFLTPQWYARWGKASVPGARRTPLFVFGFPRSGTTLLDTLLGGHDDAVVLEEEATVDRLAEAAGPIDRLLEIDQAEIERLRAVYFAEVDRIAPDAGGRLIVDKQPLALGSTPILHRVFPDARFVFVERHPCDVVLSCFIMSAQMDAKVANFFDFVSTARLYDSVLGFWERCREVLDIDVLAVRYERLIANPEDEMRRLAAFAGLDWSERLLTNQSNAADRAYIGSPSYSQVAEPIYTRARGRWLRYRDHMETVLPILRPWLDRMKYDEGVHPGG